MVVTNMDGPTRDQVLKLMEEKDKIEREIADLGSVLEKNHVGMLESLVDDNGFPRNDIDVYQVRHARHRIICLQNDHKALMKQIEKGLHTLHSGQSIEGTGSSTSNTSNSRIVDESQIPMDIGNDSHQSNNSVASQVVMNGFSHAGAPPSLSNLRVSIPRAIAKVNFVSPGSPAEEAGIMVDDEILEFGSLNSSNFRALTQIAEIVQHSVNRRVDVKILRGPGDHLLDVALIPHAWSGRGLLGCNILPIEDI